MWVSTTSCVDVTPETTEALAGLRAMLVRGVTRVGASEDAVSEARCPTEGRLAGGCASRQMSAMNYYYSTGEHATMTAEIAREHCAKELRGAWVD